ncbi:hypothetical protein FACS1894182_03790 [Bacteroidia bacterium]|nr:hypothetical protein FACS1894182_03790 [Bacteroidia bacterium]
MRKGSFIWHALFGLAVVAGFSAVVMVLWNGLMPAIFGLVAINFWEALGLLVLVRILFGGFSGLGGHWRMGMHRHHHNPIREKWMEMTPEERKEFMKKRHFGRRFGHDFFHEDNPEKQD